MRSAVSDSIPRLLTSFHSEIHGSFFLLFPICPTKSILYIAISDGYYNRTNISKNEAQKLKILKEKEIQTIKEAFIKNCHPRFMKYFFCHMPLGRKEAYAKAVIEASLERLTRLIKVCGFLMQTKVYLFWKTPQLEKQNDNRAFGKQLM